MRYKNLDEIYNDGRDAVRAMPLHRPQNPWDEFQTPICWAAWEDGAVSAGICDFWQNGEMLPEFRYWALTP